MGFKRNDLARWIRYHGGVIERKDNMTVTVNDICAAMDRWAPPGLAADWDRVGLSVGDPRAKVRCVFTCLTITREVFKAAEKAGAAMIVAHHPLIFQPLQTLRFDEPHTRLCLDIAKAGIACFAAHTNLDVVSDGVSHVLAKRLALNQCKPLFPVREAKQVKLVSYVPESHLAAVQDAVSGAGAGHIGEYTYCSFNSPGTGTFKPGTGSRPFSGIKGKVNEVSELRFETLVNKVLLPQVLQALIAAHPYEEVPYDIVVLENCDASQGLGVRGELVKSMALGQFADVVRDTLKLSHVRFVGPAKKKVRTVAVLGGSGGGEVSAIPDDIDVYITGDIKYHDADLALLRKLALIDAGHVGTERPIVPVMAQYLRRQFKGLKVIAEKTPEVFCMR
jgi:dinuclear metal center YbgI/SA1388 family protein